MQPYSNDYTVLPASDNGWTVYVREIAAHISEIHITRTSTNQTSSFSNTIQDVTLPHPPARIFRLPMYGLVGSQVIDMVGAAMLNTNGSITMTCTGYGNNVSMMADGLYSY